MEERKGKFEKTPEWTMDVMILSNLNDLSKLVDLAAYEVGRGNNERMIDWVSALMQFYRNVKNFLQDTDVAEIDKRFELINKHLDTVSHDFPPDNIFRSVLSNIEDINEILYILRNNIFMRYTIPRNPEQELKDFMLPKDFKPSSS